MKVMVNILCVYCITAVNSKHNEVVASPAFIVSQVATPAAVSTMAHWGQLILLSTFLLSQTCINSHPYIAAVCS